MRPPSGTTRPSPTVPHLPAPKPIPLRSVAREHRPMVRDLNVGPASWLANHTIQAFKTNKGLCAETFAEGWPLSLMAQASRPGAKSNRVTSSGLKQSHPLILVPCWPAQHDSNVIPSPKVAGSSPSGGQVFEAKNRHFVRIGGQKGVVSGAKHAPC